MTQEPYVMHPFTQPIDAVAALPGSKSITNRALVCASLAHGKTVLSGVLVADDTEAMLSCLRGVGVTISTVDGVATTLSVEGCSGQIQPGPASLNARLSGTTSRFVAPLCTLGVGEYVLDAEAPMRVRPMKDLVQALQGIGLDVSAGEGDFLPITVRVSRSDAKAVGAVKRVVHVPGNRSSQFLSGLLLVAPCWAGGAEILVTGELVSRPYVDMTLAVMRAFGAVVTEPQPGRFLVDDTGYTSPGQFEIEPDASAASYFLGAAAICGGRIVIYGLGSKSYQGDVRFASILGQMGCDVQISDDRIVLTAPAPAPAVGPGTGRLRGVSVDMADCSDTAQTLAAVAVFADGPTTVTGIDFIRRKETDRIAAVVSELRRCGIEATEDADGFTILPGPIRSAQIETYHDHRMAMSFALIGLRTEGISILDPGCVEKTFPDYFAAIEKLRFL